MSFQPDFILEYAHYLGDHYNKQGSQKHSSICRELCSSKWKIKSAIY